MPDPRILRAQALWEALFKFALSIDRDQYRQAHQKAFPGLQPPDKPIPEKPWRDFMEDFVFDRNPGNDSIVDRFLEAGSALSRTDRALLKRWRAPYKGFFLLRHHEQGTNAFSLVNEMDFPLAGDWKGHPEGSAMVTRMFALSEGEYLTGAHSVLPEPAQVETVISTALHVQSQAPWMAFGANEEKRAVSTALATARRAFFLETFGTDEVRGAGRELAESFKKFRSSWLEKETRPALYPDMNVEIPEEILEADDVGMLMDETYGLGLLKNYGAFLEACESGALKDETAGETVAAYVASMESIPHVWQRALERFPEGTRGAARAVLKGDAETEIDVLFELLQRPHRRIPPVVAVMDPALASAIPPPPA